MEGLLQFCIQMQLAKKFGEHLKNIPIIRFANFLAILKPRDPFIGLSVRDDGNGSANPKRNSPSLTHASREMRISLPWVSSLGR